MPFAPSPARLPSALRLCTGLGRRPFSRQHTNPLLLRYAAAPPEFTSWRDAFADPSLPLHLDIGSAAGGLLLELARRQPGRNFLGLELRAIPLAQARLAAARAGLLGRNLAFLCTNLERSNESWFASPRPGPLDVVSILHPDPCYKSRHFKRRVVSSALVRLLAAHQCAGARLLLQTDVEPLFDSMLAIVEGEAGLYARLPPEAARVPLFEGVTTEREALVRRQGGPLFAAAFGRTGREVQVGA